MWMITPSGAWYVSAHRNEPDNVLIRTRRREHLEHLQSLFEKLSQEDLLKAQPVPDIVVLDERSDFPYRMTLFRRTWGILAKHLANQITYGSFKGETSRRWGYSHPFYTWLVDTWRGSFRSADAEAIRTGSTYTHPQAPATPDGGLGHRTVEDIEYGDTLGDLG